MVHKQEECQPQSMRLNRVQEPELENLIPDFTKPIGQLIGRQQWMSNAEYAIGASTGSK